MISSVSILVFIEAYIQKAIMASNNKRHTSQIVRLISQY
jgi:hypothetical protein